MACENWAIVLTIINLIPKCHLYNCLCNYENMYICLYLEVIVRTSRPSFNFLQFLDTQYPYFYASRLTHLLTGDATKSLAYFPLSLSLSLSQRYKKKIKSLVRIRRKKIQDSKILKRYNNKLNISSMVPILSKK